MTSTERTREMEELDLVTSEKQQRIDEIEVNLEKLKIPEGIRKSIMDEISACLKVPSVGWFDMPQEMREMMIEEMDIETKCKFTQCSKKCEDEVKESNNFVTAIRIKNYDHPKIYVGLGGNSGYQYCLKFIEVRDSYADSKTMVVYEKVSQDRTPRDMRMRNNNEKWMKMEEGNAEEVQLKYINEYITKYKRTIEKFEVHDWDFQFSNFDWQQLTRLNCYNCVSYNCRDSPEWMDFSQIKKMNTCHLPETQFTFEEIQQFEGQRYYIVSTDVNEQNYENYLKLLRNGEVHRNLERLDVVSGCDMNSINFERIAKSLDAFDFDQNDFDVHFRFLLKYERKSKCYCQVIAQVEHIFSFVIVSDNYDEVMKNRQPLDF
ncbi:unnamed protein product [Caenorhabditis angaria]|uniref:F-box domain-containing protein n=1 Tax=Caenorhabditis angaria TaxID=860376 RepID=A0A9P1IEK7_9PELO|nr:unnamed protein product [Caenorhabditis angaria]